MGRCPRLIDRSSAASSITKMAMDSSHQCTRFRGASAKRGTSKDIPLFSFVAHPLTLSIVLLLGFVAAQAVRDVYLRHR